MAETEFSVIEQPNFPLEQEEIDFAVELSAPSFVAQMLYRMGINEKEEARQFFIPTDAIRLNPSALKGMDQAVEKLLEIRRMGQKILIHGDYDVDGITGTALFYQGLRSCGFRNVEWFIPSRFEGGYGLTPENIDQFKQRGVRWILTVDTGVSAVEETEYARSKGIDLIITDHHQPGESLPKAHSVVNPNCRECSYPNKSLSGVGVAFKVLEKLFDRLGKRNRSEEYLDLVVLGSLADVVPVVGENRLFLRRGMKLLANSSRPGIQVLLRDSGVQQNLLRSQDILFRMTPLINAVGRMGDPSLAMKLLITSDLNDARKILKKLKEVNVQRRELESETSQQAIQAWNDHGENSDPVALIDGSDWHVGVVGIVAARMVDRVQRPVAIISFDQDGVGKASARSFANFDWHQALAECDDLLEKWGGHKSAAGFTVLQKNYPEFKQRILQSAQKQSYSPDGVSRIRPDFNLDFNEISRDSLQWLHRFEPFGTGNESPLFYAAGVQVGNECRIVGGNHLKLSLSQNGNTFDAIGFGLGGLCDRLADGNDNLVVAFRPVWNVFRDTAKIQLQISGIALQSGA